VQLDKVAERWYERLRALVENMYEPLAICLAKQGRHNEAVRLCLEAAESDPSERPVVTLTSVLLIGKPSDEDFSRAEPILAQALEKYKDNSALLSAVASVRFVQGRLEEAGAIFERVLQANPNDFLALNNLAATLGELPDRRADAMRYIERAIQIAGPRANLLDTKGTILVRDGKASQASPLLEEAASSPRSDPRYHLHLAEAYFRLGDLPKARASFNQARDSDLTSQVLTKADVKVIGELQKTLLP
jgi:Flp pilus assembly protein TadD